MQRTIKPLLLVEKMGMTGSQCIDAIRQLAHSQGFYGRLYANLRTLEDNQPEDYANILQHFEEKAFQDSLDLVMYLEC